MERKYIMKEIKLYTRGIGQEFGLGCFVCGIKQKLMNNISVFVPSKEEGEEVEKWFKGSYLDFRPREPNWIQLKIGACDKHKDYLTKLNTLIASKINISKEDVDNVCKVEEKE